MGNSISRIAEYYRRHGLVATIRRAGLAATRALIANRMVVFYCDLNTQTAAPSTLPDSFKVDRLNAELQIGAQDLDQITRFWMPEVVKRNIEQRFAQGASLWLIKSGEKLAGYGWTLKGGSIEPYYFPLGSDDVHLFDFYVFPHYRGRGINPRLVAYILRELAADCGGRAFIEAAEWNQAQLSSLRKTEFLHLGLVRSFSVFGGKYVHWVEGQAAEQIRKDAKRSNQLLRIAKSHE
ncbi:MAG TPA: GNAT family N-acetyltransferase [Candidatus Sulfotelmatobacter sp.]|nr:GNAT family N-acetyltransferase [Candidatus Sulfotelmatobacter sp.]